MHKKYLFLSCIGIAGMVLAENFIVKKTKQLMVNYDDQWCELFGKLMQEFADFDMEKSKLQKNGIQEIMHLFEDSTESSFAQLSQAQQKELVMELQKVFEQASKATQQINAYNKKVMALLPVDKSSKNKL